MVISFIMDSLSLMHGVHFSLECSALELIVTELHALASCGSGVRCIEAGVVRGRGSDDKSFE